MTGFDFLDQDVGLEYCAGDEEIYREIIEGYLEEDRRAELVKYYETDDLANYRVVAHAIKSTSLTIGATELSAKAKALEYAAADGRIWPWQERVKSSNAGMPSLKPERGLYINSPEWLIFQGGRTASEQFFLRVGNSKFGRNRLMIPPFGETSLFELYPGKRIAVAAAQGFFANSKITKAQGLLTK